MLIYTHLNPGTSEKASTDFCKISTNDTYSITPQEKPREEARKRLLASFINLGEKTIAAPRPVDSPAPTTSMNANKTLSSEELMRAGIGLT